MSWCSHGNCSHTRNSSSLEWQRKHKFTRQWLFQGLAELMGLWEEIPAEAQAWGRRRWGLWLAWATITLSKHISTSLCQVLGRICTLLIKHYHLPHVYLTGNKQGISQASPVKSQFPSCRQTAYQVPLNPWQEKDSGRTWIWNEIVYWSCRRSARLSCQQHFGERLTVPRCLQKKILIL